MEQRISPRIPTHFSAGWMTSEHTQQQFGYVENLSEQGMGMVTLEYFPPGTQISSSFFLPEFNEKLNIIATVVHAKKSVDMIYYHGFHFNLMRDRDRMAIRQFLNQQLSKIS